MQCRGKRGIKIESNVGACGRLRSDAVSHGAWRLRAVPSKSEEDTGGMRAPGGDSGTCLG